MITEREKELETKRETEKEREIKRQRSCIQMTPFS